MLDVYDLSEVDSCDHQYNLLLHISREFSAVFYCHILLLIACRLKL